MPQHVEWPTVGLIVGFLAAFAGVVVWHHALPWPITLALFAVLGCFQLSLLHEVLHGHPTPNQRLNEALVMLPAVVYLPYATYRDSHRLHHRSELTVPGVDPESFYVDAETWQRASSLWRGVLWLNRTLAGRILVWPGVAIVRVLADAVRTVPGDRRLQRRWAGHLATVAVTLWVVCGLGEVPVWLFVGGFAYLGLGLTNVRSFVEHLAVDSGTPCAVVRAHPFWTLLFLNNNLHHTHHAAPDAAWYRLPELHRALGSDELAAEGAGLYRGYGEVFRRHLVRPFSQPVHPAQRVAGATAIPAAGT